MAVRKRNSSRRDQNPSAEECWSCERVAHSSRAIGLERSEGHWYARVVRSTPPCHWHSRADLQFQLRLREALRFVRPASRELGCSESDRGFQSAESSRLKPISRRSPFRRVEERCS